jgi:hypothetical protein
MSVMFTMAPRASGEVRRRRLRQEQRRLEVGADEVVPLGSPISPTGVGKKLEALFTSASSRPKR